jgi:hypothetical protein
VSQHLNAGNFLRIAFLVIIGLCVAIDLRRRRDGREARVTQWAVGLWSGVVIAFTVFLWADHIRFPFLLDLMEGTILQHVSQAAHGLPVYPWPTPGYVPLAYNPLYYYLCVPVTWVLGLGFPALRLVAIVAMAGSGAVIYSTVRQWTGSAWWGLAGAGLFAAAYRAMDAYLDTAHSDSWLLFAILLGTYVIDRATTRVGRFGGVIILVSAFWFKQHGALFALGGVAFLTYREGWRASWRYWVAAGILGPLLYVAATAWPFGPAFHYFTWDVPRGWSTLNAGALVRVLGFTARYYLPLAVGAAIPLIRAWRRREPVRVWHVQLLAGAASALMGALDYGSSDNVFIPFGAFLLVLGTIGLAEATRSAAVNSARLMQAATVAVAFFPLIYDPSSVILSPLATTAYTELVGVVHSLDGPVYAPDIGELGEPPLFHPGAHWVALEDMGRGPGHTDADRARAGEQLAPAEHPGGTAYVLTNIPLSRELPPVSALASSYVLVTDYGDRFAPLAGLPKRYDHKFPRYLYRFASSGTTAAVIVPRAEATR